VLRLKEIKEICMTKLTRQYIDDHCVNSGISRDQITEIQFISTTDYLKQNYSDFFNLIQSEELNIDLTSVNAFDLIIKLHQEDFQPNWKTIATTFNERSMDQIHSILSYFNKTSCMPNTENSTFFKITGKVPATLNGLSMFLNPTDHANLTMTAKNVILRTKEETQKQEEEHRSAACCSIQ